MKSFKNLLSCLSLAMLAMCVMVLTSCESNAIANTSALDEQAHTEVNQQHLNQVQPAPTITWSLERQNLINRFKLQNDRGVMFYMYVFNEGSSQPIGYYLVNKVSSVNSQLTNTQQLVRQYLNGSTERWIDGVLPSPAEDGSYGTNGDAVFGFTPEQVYIETNMHYITSTVPLKFANPVTRLAIIDTKEAEDALNASKSAMK
jgi:hypothetical protein